MTKEKTIINNNFRLLHDNSLILKYSSNKLITDIEFFKELDNFVIECANVIIAESSKYNIDLKYNQNILSSKQVMLMILNYVFGWHAGSGKNNYAYNFIKNISKNYSFKLKNNISARKFYEIFMDLLKIHKYNNNDLTINFLDGLAKCIKSNDYLYHIYEPNLDNIPISTPIKLRDLIDVDSTMTLQNGIFVPLITINRSHYSTFCVGSIKFKNSLTDEESKELSKILVNEKLFEKYSSKKLGIHRSNISLLCQPNIYDYRLDYDFIKSNKELLNQRTSKLKSLKERFNKRSA